MIDVSIIHSIVTRQLMKSKVMYSSDNKPDYVQARENDRKQTILVPVPKNISIEEIKLGSGKRKY